MKKPNTRQQKGLALAAAYLATIVIAAWLVVTVGIVPVGFGLYAPAAAYVVGLTMTLRDLTQDQLGPKATYLAMIGATILSALLSPQVALASAGAFFASETLDFLVYTPIRKRGHLITAVLLSNTVGIAADSFIFLRLAFGNLDYFAGQCWAKIVGTIVAIIILKIVYRNRTDMTPTYLREKAQNA